MPPIISIITVVFNGEAVIERTIQSVLAQTYPHIEYIVIDGASRDATVERCAPYRNRIAVFVSEPDTGLYDAMNKGLNLATGDFVWYVNAGDTLFTPTTVADMVACQTPKTDIFFGEVMLTDENNQPLGTRSELTTRRLPERLTFASMRYGMVVSHQAFVPRRVLAKPYLTNNLCADIDWVLTCLQRCERYDGVATHTHLTLAAFQLGGISTTRRRRSWLDRFVVMRKHFGLLPTLFAHAYITARHIATNR